MKRITLLFFIFLLLTITSLPSSQVAASKREGKKHRHQQEFPPSLKSAKKYAKMDPHAGYQAWLGDAEQRIFEVSQTTSQVTARLPHRKPFELYSKNGPTHTQLDNNLIDEEIFRKLAERGVVPATLATDEEFIRRVSLDITGKQPTIDEILAYLSSNDPQKKEKLVDRLLDSTAYIDFWTNWMGDLLRNLPRAADKCDRNALYFYLKDAVTKNRSFDQITRDVLTYNGPYCDGPGAYLVKQVFNVETDQDFYDELAAETARTFLGTQAICISCHNGAGHLEKVNLYFSTKQRKQFWQYSAFFAQTIINFPPNDPYFLKLLVGNDPGGYYDANTREGSRPPRNGGVIEPSYEVFGGAPLAQGANRRQAIADLIITDPQFSRAFTNRVFARFFTLGLVEPLDGFDLARLDPQNPPAPETGFQLQASHPLLLLKLGDYFQQNGFDLKRLIKLITTSQSYALSSTYDERVWKPEYTRLYARKLVRRLDAEEVLDGVANATAVPFVFNADGINSLFKSTVSLPGPDEPSFGRSNTDDFFTVFRFLQDFGRGDRNTIPRASNGSILQALHLFNSDLVLSRTKNQNGIASLLKLGLQQGKYSADDTINILYLATLSRFPSADELIKAKTLMGSSGEDLDDLQWALINRLDFVYNY